MEALSDWPVEFGDQLILGNTESDVGICSLWSDKQRIATQLAPNDFAVIGNLYSRAGINWMLRNLFANPKIRYLVLTGHSLTDSHDALIHFFNDGVDENGRIKGNGGQIDKSFPMDALDELRRAVILLDLTGSASFPDSFHQFLKSYRRLGPFGPPRVFPHVPFISEQLPSEGNGFIIRADTILNAWSQVIHLVMRFGRVLPTDYGLPQRELLNVVSVIQSPSTQIAAIPDFAEFTAPEIPKYIEYFLAKEASPTAAYGYGNRLQAYFGVNQIDSIVADLQRSEFSRRALAILWDPRTDSDSANPPCLTTIQASIREGRLQLTSFVRSHDVFRAYPLNAAALAELQARLATQLGVIGPGPLTLVSQSAHIYSDCWHSASSSLAVQGRHTKFDQDLRGSFVFRLSGSDLIADHYSVQGDWLQNFAATSANTLFRLLSPFVSRVDHALYLGREIARLEFSRKSGTVYRQDRTD